MQVRTCTGLLLLCLDCPAGNNNESGRNRHSVRDDHPVRRMCRSNDSKGELMNRHQLAGALCAGILAVISTSAAAIGVTYLAPGWSSGNFLTLTTSTRAIEFDAAGNLYIEDTSDDGGGVVEILKLDAASGYSSTATYASYASAYPGVTGLAFDGLGNLYVSERSLDGDAGIIRKIDAGTQTLLGDVMTFNNHRPTGIDADASGNIHYSGRKESDGTWGNIYDIDSTLTRSIVLGGTVATGIALDAAGNIFISTPQRTDLALLANSIYSFDPNDPLNPVLIATFDQRGGELAFDPAGNLYMVGDDKVSIVRLSAIPLPPALYLFGSGLLALLATNRHRRVGQPL